MSKRPRSSNPLANSSHDPLVERVHARVARAARAIRRRDAAGLPTPRPTGDDLEPLSYELRALRLVYHSLGRAYRRHRDQTGETVTPALRAAAREFKKDPTVLSLAPVAGHLDRMGLLTW